MALPLIPLLVGAGALFMLMSGKKKTAPTSPIAATIPGATVTTPGVAVTLPSGNINIPTSVVPAPVATMTTEQRIEKARGYQTEVINALAQLGVDESGGIASVPSETAIHYASGVVARMKADGFVAEAAALDRLVQKAINMTPAATIVELPGIPEALQTEVNNAIQYSKDPKKLRALSEALLKLPGAATDQNIQNTVAMVNQVAAQLEAQQVVASGVQQAEQILAQSMPPEVPIPHVPVAEVPPIAVTPVQAVAAPKTPVETAADLMVAHLKRIQLSAGSVTAAKGKEDKNTVKKFQTLAKLTSDGKPGPGTLVAAASFGQFELPLVMYWPTSATKQKVYDYRTALEGIADKLESTNPVGAQQLRASALRERGQAGIVGGAIPA